MFRVKGDTVEIFPAYLETALRVEFYGNTVESIREFKPLTGEVILKKQKSYIYPAKLFVTSREKIENVSLLYKLN